MEINQKCYLDKYFVVSLPMPLLPPVITTTLPVRSFFKVSAKRLPSFNLFKSKTFFLLTNTGSTDPPSKGKSNSTKNCQGNSDHYFFAANA